MKLDRASSEPLHRQLADALRLAIRRGELPRGTALPSTRTLARDLGLSRNTVLSAYDELTSEGLLAARRGSATRVCGPSRPTVSLDWSAILRGSQYPIGPVAFRDHEGNALYFHR